MVDFRGIALLVCGMALVALAAVADAGSLYLGYGNSDFYFEVYSGNAYSYATVPYTYAYNDYYYFDYPYRVYSSGVYNYYDAGWYRFDPYWSTASFCASCYSYYPSNYYFYDGYWSYSPGWINSYGQQYYGSYYFPPSGQATLVGQEYQPRQEASCRQLTLTTNPVSVDAWDNGTATFYINNFSRKYIDIANAEISIEGFGVRATNVRFDKTIASGSQGKIQFDVKAESYADTGSLDATVRVSGTFRDIGTYCSPSDVSQDFTVNVFSAAQNTSTFTQENFQSSVQGSTAYLQAKETQQGWTEVSGDSWYDNYNPDDSYVPQYSYGNDGYGNGGYNYGNDGSQRIITYYGETQLAAQSCSGLSITGDNVSADSGETKTVYYTLKNFASEDFVIDSMGAVEYSPDFSIEVSRDSRTVYAGGNGALKARVLASETEQDSTGTAYIKVFGHFGSGLSCEVLSDNFYVRVNGTDRSTAADIELVAPPKVAITGTSGFITYRLGNPSNEQVTVEAYSNDAGVSPAKATFSAKSGGVRTIAVNGFTSSEGRVFLRVSAGGNRIFEKFVDLEFRGSAPGAQAPGGNGGTGGDADNGLVSTGFANLGRDALAAGIIILALIAILLYAGRESIKVPEQ